MTAQEAIQRLEQSLQRDAAGRYSFCCKKAFVMVRLQGRRDGMRFSAKDKVAFRTEGEHLTIESREGIVRKRFLWSEIECLAAGEPEVDNSSLFQG